MKKTILLAALSTALSFPALYSSAYAQSLGCANLSGLPQQQVNQCALQDYQDADKQLNSAWNVVKQHMDGISATAGNALLDGQRGWIAYRDGQCNAKAAKFTGGSIEPYIANSCKANFTRKRILELLELLREG